MASGVLEIASAALVDPGYVSTTSRCCCTVSAWRAPRTLTGSLANTPDYGYHGRYHGRTTFSQGSLWRPSSKRRTMRHEDQGEPSTTETFSMSKLWDSLLSSISYLSQNDLEKVKAALKLAFRAHDGQKRRSGEPYIIHPVEVGRILGELEMDWETIAAGLLHDTVEDTEMVTFALLEEEFGLNVRRIVEGETKVSKLGKIQCCDAESTMRDVQADDLRQMFLAMTEEVRVIIVKLADRLHNMRTLSFMPPHKQKYISQETLQIFAPLARLLGMYKIKAELDELSFMYAHPSEYVDTKRRVESLFKRQTEIVNQAKHILVQALERDPFLNPIIQDAKVLTLCKEPYSIYKKTREANCTVEELGDVAQVRIVLQPKADSSFTSNLQQTCYHVLGLVHSLWRPVPQTMKDYIATPKPNGYQSLHTKVIPFGANTFSPLEIQIRTHEMDRLAEFGIAVHYSGKSSKPINGTANRKLKPTVNGLNAKDLARRVSWLNSIREWQEEFVGNMSSREFVDTITGDLLGRRVFVFTPKGEIKNLPKGATVIDYAYQIHTDVGNKMVAAKVNGNLVSPTHVLSNAEVVEILTYEGVSNKKHFTRHQRWLRFARTRSARHKLTKFLREQATLSAIELTADAIKKFLRTSAEDNDEIVLDGNNNALISLRGAHPRNDTPSYIPKLLPAQDAMMYGAGAINGKYTKRADLVGRRGTYVVGSAASNSQQSLPHLNAVSIQDEARPTLEAWLIGRVTMWQGLGSPVQWFTVSCLDRKCILADVSTLLSAAGILIYACVAETDRLKGLGTMLFHVDGETQNLIEACSSIHSIEGVLNWSAGCSWLPPEIRAQQNTA